VVAAGNNELFKRLSNLLGHPEWLDDERFKTNPARVKNRRLVDELIQEPLRGKSSAQWAAEMESAGIPCAPVQTIDQTLAHPQTQALGIVQEVPGSSMTMVGIPARFDGERPRIRQAPSALNADADLLAPYVKTAGTLEQQA
jgi:crotonobetainyl-CoA:carnitine CoA-transferase CaiB-like acyl-CoA transferase